MRRYVQSKHTKIGAIIFTWIIVFLGYYFYKKIEYNHGVIKQNSVMVEVASVTQQTIPIEVHAIGDLSAANNIQLTAEIAGQVADILVQDGMWVKKGMPIIQLDDKVQKAKLASTKAALLYSQTDYDRKRLLGKQGAIAQQAIDQALADLQEKKAMAEESQVTVDKMKLVAPFDGALGQIKVSPGDYVTVGQALVPLTDIEHLHIEYSVPEKYLSQLKLGQSIKVTTSAYPNREFIGKIAYISPTINAEDRTISLYADVANGEHLLTAGLFVNVVHELGVEKNAIVLPAASLMPTIDGEQVFKIVNNKAVAVPIKIVQRSQNQVQVLSSLKAGDQVVIAGQQKLKEGLAVNVNHSATTG